MPPFQSPRLRCRFVSTRAGTAALIGLAVAAIAPAVAVAREYRPQSQSQYGMKAGTQPAKVSIENNVVTVTNPAGNGQSISGWDLMLNDVLVDNVQHTPRGNKMICYQSDPPSPDNPPSWGSSVGCDEGGKRLGAQQEFIPPVAPGETASWQIPGLDFDINNDDEFNRFSVVWIDNECVQKAQGRRAPLAFAAALDECDRERLGTPRVLASRVNRSKLVLIISGAPAGWATRLFGASSPRKLKTARSGKTLSTVAPSPGGYPRLGNGTVKAGSSIKFVREAWTRAGERPILSPVVRVTK